MLVIGIGNRQRSDDAVGLLAAAAVRRGLEPGIAGQVEVIEHEGDMSQLVEWLEQADRVYLIDAAASGAAPGTIHRLDAHTGTVSKNLYRVSSHGFGLAEAVELARAMGTLPGTCVIYAVEGESFEPGTAVSTAVAGAVHDVVARLEADLYALLPDKTDA